MGGGGWGLGLWGLGFRVWGLGFRVGVCCDMAQQKLLGMQTGKLEQPWPDCGGPSRQNLVLQES